MKREKRREVEYYEKFVYEFFSEERRVKREKKWNLTNVECRMKNAELENGLTKLYNIQNSTTVNCSLLTVN